jgi:hypothetical protein
VPADRRHPLLVTLISLQELWISYNSVESLKGIRCLKKLRVRLGFVLRPGARPRCKALVHQQVVAPPSLAMAGSFLLTPFTLLLVTADALHVKQQG